VGWDGEGENPARGVLGRDCRVGVWEVGVEAGWGSWGLGEEGEGDVWVGTRGGVGQGGKGGVGGGAVGIEARKHE
jgi:hypothetical protein